MNDIKLIDVSLRDGGYLNNWQFSKDQIKRTCCILDEINIDYIEVGYLCDESCLEMSHKSALSLLSEIKESMNHSKLFLMLTPKNQAVHDILESYSEYIECIRIPCDFSNISDALALARSVRNSNIKVSLNLTSITQYFTDELLKLITSNNLTDATDMLCLADSRGTLQPEEVLETILAIKLYYHNPIGFHGHDNLGTALQNTLSSIDAGCELVDGSVNGFGLGGGNTDIKWLLKHIRKMDIECRDVKQSIKNLEQVLSLAKPTGLEKRLYQLSASKNLEQEWVPFIIEKYKHNSVSQIERLHKKKYKNTDDIHEIFLEYEENEVDI